MPKVSVVVQTYNHAPYLAACLDGILNQSTSFDVEILVHDDASTDGTSDILRDYASRYPSIQAWIQTENQYKLGMNAFILNASRATGDYLAVCDGDDEWIDPLKLQRQVDHLDHHPECALVVHAFEKVLASDPNRKTRVRYPQSLVDLGDMIKAPGCYFSYSTFMFRRQDLDFGEDFAVLRITDLPRLLYSGIIGEIHYLDEVMSRYRKGVPNSYNYRNLIAPQTTIAHTHRAIEFFTRLKTHAPHYEALIDQRIQGLQVRLCVKSRDPKMRHALHPVISALPFKQRLAFELEYHFPRIYRRYLARRLSHTL